jgi:hypothetical protein
MMKVHVDIDCTPEEARTFLGLPDVSPMQAAIMEEVKKRMMASLEAMAPEALFKTWLPASLERWEQLQKVFWRTLESSAPVEDKTGE